MDEFEKWLLNSVRLKFVTDFELNYESNEYEVTLPSGKRLTMAVNELEV